jgi:hypothetical protein
MNKIILTLVIIILIVVGFGGGFFLGKRTANQTNKNTNLKNSVLNNPPVADLANSPLLTSAFFVMSGNVSAIDGRILTLTSNEKIFSTSIDEGAQIFSVSLPSKDPKSSTSSFDAIKIGDRVSVTVGGAIENNFIFSGKGVTIIIASK